MAKSTSARRGSDPFGSLEEDHRRVDGLFGRLESSKPGAPRLAVFLQLKDALSRHAVLEEHIVYPALRCTPTPATQLAATAAFDEHEDLKGTLAAIESTDPESELFLAQCRVLRAQVEAHVQQEEGEVFPTARKHIAARRLEDLAARLAATRAEQEDVASPPQHPERRRSVR